MFEWDEESGRDTAMQHPFTASIADSPDDLRADPANTPSDDILGNPRPVGMTQDIGVVEVEMLISATGDLNLDGSLTTDDIQLCVGVILGIENDQGLASRADLNGDGTVSVQDLQRLINLVISEDGRSIRR